MGRGRPSLGTDDPAVSGPGITEAEVRANLAARRWRRIGRAVVLHNGPLTREEQREVALACSGRHAVLASFTALEKAGLRHWDREEIHVLIGSHDRRPADPGLGLRVHRTTRWSTAATELARPRLGFAAVTAASSFDRPRPGAGLLAAVVQQRLTTAAVLERTLRESGRWRHRNALLLAVADIAMGSEALSEIDFVRLCRRFGLPPPERQEVRLERSGRRHYLDASWRRADGVLIAVEVDGSLHLSARRWWADQLRQNERVVAGARVIRFPSVIVREEPELVAGTLRQALFA